MTNPNTTIVDVLTNIHIIREMTDEEYAELLEFGWTEEEVTSEE